MSFANYPKATYNNSAAERTEQVMERHSDPMDYKDLLLFTGFVYQLI